MRTLVVLRSRNAKVGPIACTYRTADTCPTLCPLRERGCYAHGRVFALARGGTEDPSYANVRALASSLPDGGMVRVNVSGDILDEDGRIDSAYLGALSEVATTRPDALVYGYTHAWRQTAPGIAPGVVLNASTESREGLEEAIEAGWPTTVVDDGSLVGSTIGGRRVVVCPAQTRDDVTCASCRLCARPERRSTVAFLIHGPSKRRAADAVAAVREV